MSTSNLSRGVEGGQRVWLTTSLPSVSRLSRKCGIIDVSTIWASTACYKDSFILPLNATLAAFAAAVQWQEFLFLQCYLVFALSLVYIDELHAFVRKEDHGRA
jgi:hypothetical protein